MFGFVTEMQSGKFINKQHANGVYSLNRLLLFITVLSLASSLYVSVSQSATIWHLSTPYKEEQNVFANSV